MKTIKSKISRPKNRLVNHDSYGSLWTSGTVCTKHGFVDVYAEDNITVLRFIFKGHEYEWIKQKGYTYQGIVTLANRLANQVVLK